MKLYNVKLLTVTCEILAQKNVIDLLTKHNILGYTTYEVEGNGARGLRGQGFKNEKNVKVEVIMQEDKIQDVTEEIARTLFTNYAIILYVSDVGVIRSEKFI
jgi:nitrogen regulatory protein PII